LEIGNCQLEIHQTKNIVYGFGTKARGDGRDPKARMKLVSSLKSNKQIYCALASQRHTTNIWRIHSADDLYNIPAADGIITTLSHIVLTTLTADCAPMIYFDPVNNIIGISHQGWRGTLDGLPVKMIETMEQEGANREHIRCSIGPCIQSCCYRVYGKRLAQFATAFSTEVFRTDEKQNRFLSLTQANKTSLLQTGIRPVHITFSSDCTKHLAEDYFSYQRSGYIEGEMLNFIVRGI
jgi:polyphenol oxidase